MALVKSYTGRIQVGKRPNIYTIEGDAHSEIPDWIAYALDDTKFDIVYDDIVEDSSAEKRKIEDRKSKQVEAKATPKEKRFNVDDLYSMNKEEQVNKLKKLGLSDKVIKKLKLEKDRVAQILKLS